MAVHEQIVELLGLPEAGSDAPSLERLEDTLTEGYAQALALEAERLRIERRLGEVARDPNGGSVRLGDELRSLSQRLRAADGELVRLRAMLGTLHDRARAARRSLAHG